MRVNHRMYCRSMFLFRCSYNHAFSVKSQVICIRPLSGLISRSRKWYTEPFTHSTERLQPMATKVKKKRRPTPASTKDEKEPKGDGMLRKFFIVILPMTLLGIVVIATVVMSFGIMQSVKENSHNFYKGTHLGLYREASDKCKQNSLVAETLGHSISEVKSSQDKVKVTCKVVDKVQYFNMEFTLKGSFKEGIVSLEASKKQDEDFRILYILVKTDDDEIVIEDNR